MEGDQNIYVPIVCPPYQRLVMKSATGDLLNFIKCYVSSVDQYSLGCLAFKSILQDTGIHINLRGTIMYPYYQYTCIQYIDTTYYT